LISEIDSSHQKHHTNNKGGHHMKSTTRCLILLALLSLLATHRSNAGTGNIKSWRVQVTIESHFREDAPGWFHTVDLMATIAGTITDNMMPAGGHYSWPMPALAEAMNPESARKLTTTLRYEEVTHQDGAGAAMPEENEVCKSNIGKGGVAFSMPSGFGKWGAEFGVSEIVATCSGGTEGTKTPASVSLTIEAQPVPADISEIKGKRKIVVNGREYTVTYSFKPATKD
jgi:hypothetical protein